MRIIISILAAGVATAWSQKVEDIYTRHCAACHGAKFEGGMGGSLVDGEWKHGASDADIYRSIAKGNLQLGMTPWEGTLSDKEIRSLVIFLREKEKQTLTKGVSFPKPSPQKVTQTKLHNYRLETVVDKGIEKPWAIAFLHDGHKLVTECSGRLRIVSPDGTLDPKPVEGLPTIIEHGQGGLMEVAAHPDHAKNGWIYLGFSDGEKGEKKCITAIARGRIKNHQWTDHEWIFRPDAKFRSAAGVHFGTRIVFHKGYLFFPIGERGGMMEAQKLSSPVGKIFRLHDDGRVPKDNPFVNTKDAIPAIWSLGHRNPQGLTLDPRDGSLYSTEHGPRGGDELNLIQPGLNYGWPVVTYGMNYNGTPMVGITEKEGIEPPLAYWVPSLAVCGLDFYTGELFPQWKHDLLSGGLAQQEVRRIRVKQGKVTEQEIILKDIGRVRDVTGAPDGSIYVVLNSPDRIVRMIPAK
jgi:glucose/arabinose dehydrogenase